MLMPDGFGLLAGGTSSTMESGKVGWAKGTGYGTGRNYSMWNPADYVKAQQEKDRQVG